MIKLVLAASALAAIAAAALAPASADASGRSVAAPAAPAVRRMTAAENNAGGVADKVSAMPAFAGIRITPDQAAIEVFVTSNDAALRATALASAGGATVRFTRVRHPYAKLRALQERVHADRALLLRQGIDLVSVGVREEHNRLAIGLVGYTAAKAEWLRRRYPGDVVEVVSEQRSELFSSRWHDYLPWNGGDFMVGIDGYGEETDSCTTGPAVKDSSGQEYLLTAGHCFVPPGQDITGYYIETRQGYHGEWGTIGWARAVMPAYGASGYDLARIKVNNVNTASGLIWRTDPPSTTCCSAPQVATIRGTVGLGLCISGAYSGERCAAHVSQFDVDYYPFGLGGPRIIHTNVLNRDNTAEAIAGRGDSGGPVYSVGVNNGLHVAGYVEGGPVDSNNNLIGVRPCPDYSSDPNFVERDYGECVNKIYFAGINSVLAATGLTLVTL